MAFCADCGSRLSYHAQNMKDSEEWDPMSGGFQCSKYRNIYQACSSHYVSIKQLEAALLKAVQVVSQYVLQDEDAFIGQLMAQWEQRQEQTTSEEKKELAAASRRITELDNLIRGLYESQINGTLPERQVQKLITQYDEEQSRLESRVSELKAKETNVTPKRADINRFVALVKKYQNITELTDDMLYEFIDKIVVHAPNGGHGKAREQKLDIYFNFIGNYLTPIPEISEEELAAMREAEEAARKRAKNKRTQERQKSKLAALKEAAKTDPAAAAELEQYYEKKREKGRKDRARAKAKREADPEYQAQQEAKRIERNKKNMERYYKNHIPIAELEELAKTDPEAAETLRIRRETQAEKNRQNKQRREERMAKDPEYAAKILAGRAESTRKHTAKRKAEFDELKERAKTDPEAAAEVEAKRIRQREASKKSLAKKQARMEADPEYATAEKAKASERAKRHYAQQKARWAEVKARAETDPEAAAELAEHLKKQSEATMASRRKLVEQAETDPEAAETLQARINHKNEWTRQRRAELVARAETDPEAAAKLADIRARETQATLRSKAKQQELAKTDPVIAAKLEAQHQHHIEYLREYSKKRKAASAGKESLNASA